MAPDAWADSWPAHGIGFCHCRALAVPRRASREGAITIRTKMVVLLLIMIITVKELAFTRYCFTSRLYRTIIFFANTPFNVQYIAQYYQLLHPPARF